VRLGLVAAGALLLAGLAAPDRHAAQVRVRVTMTAELCAAVPARLQPGDTVFVFTDRTRRPSLFTIDGRHTRYVAPRRSATMRLRLTRNGVYRFFCISRGPRRIVRTGVVAVSPRPVPPPSP